MRRALLALTICWPAAVAGDPPRAVFAPVFSEAAFGAFCQQASVGEVVAPDTAAQKIDLIPETPDIRWPGHAVPLMPGISFGIRTETPDGEVIWPVLIEVSHPPFRGSGITRQSYVTALGGEGASINAYSFDLEEEFVTGRWTFRAYHEGSTLYEVAFDVMPASALPGIGGGCEGWLGS